MSLVALVVTSVRRFLAIDGYDRALALAANRSSRSCPWSS
jgi:hypothetical protein